MFTLFRIVRTFNKRMIHSPKINLENDIVDKLANTPIRQQPAQKETDEQDYEDMFVKTVFDNIEWGGPTRGGTLAEPTRFGDWERKARCTDF